MSTGSTPEMIFGARLRAIREERRWSQADLGERLKQLGIALHQTQIARIELGRRALRLNEATALARVLNTPLQELIEASSGGGTAGLDAIAELEADIEEQRMKLMDLIIAATEAKERTAQAQAAKEQAQDTLERAKGRLAEAATAHREIEQRIATVHRRMEELGTRLKLALDHDPDPAADEGKEQESEQFAVVASDEPEISIPYDDSMVSIRIEQTGPQKWNYVVLSSDDAEIMRSGDFSSGDRVRHAREIAKHKLLHEKRRIEEIGPRQTGSSSRHPRAGRRPDR